MLTGCAPPPRDADRLCSFAGALWLILATSLFYTRNQISHFVDDEPDILDLVELTLLSEGFDVVLATTGAEALDSAGRERPDLVLLDVSTGDELWSTFGRSFAGCCEFFGPMDLFEGDGANLHGGVSGGTYAALADAKEEP